LLPFILFGGFWDEKMDELLEYQILSMRQAILTLAAEFRASMIETQVRCAIYTNALRRFDVPSRLA